MSERSEPVDEVDEFDHEEIRNFWDLARFHAKLNAAPSYFGPTALESVIPPAWSDSEDADAFVADVLANEGGSTSTPVEAFDGELPEAGVLSILCDAGGVPRALLEVTEVTAESGEVVERFRVVYAADQ